jgi:hypothetical protein
VWHARSGAAALPLTPFRSIDAASERRDNGTADPSIQRHAGGPSRRGWQAGLGRRQAAQRDSRSDLPRAGTPARRAGEPDGAAQERASRHHEPSSGRGADKAGLEKRVGTIDARIEALDKQIAQADAQVASAAAIPGAIVERPPEPRQGPPEEVFVLSGMFIVIVFFPLSVALARRIWKRSTAAVAALPHDIIERFTQIDQAVESIAVEVERIGEGQRFITRVLSEQGRPALAEPASRGVEVRARPNG